MPYREFEYIYNGLICSLTNASMVDLRKIAHSWRIVSDFQRLILEDSVAWCLIYCCFQGETVPQEGSVYKHPALRIGYVSQHATHHIGMSLNILLSFLRK